MRPTGQACWALVIVAGCAGPAPPGGCEGDAVADVDGACVPARCGFDVFPEDATDGDVFVAPWGRADARGDRDDPLDDVEAAWEVAGERRIRIASGRDGSAFRQAALLALANGDWDIAGRCPDLVVLERRDDEPWVLESISGEGRAAGLRFEGGGVFARGGTVALLRVDIVEPRVAGVAADSGAEATGSELLIEDPQEIDAGASGAGIAMQAGSSGVFEDVVVRDGKLAGVVVTGPGSTLSLRRAEIDGVSGPSAVPGGGYGASATDRAAMMLEDVDIDCACFVGIGAVSRSAVALSRVSIATRLDEGPVGAAVAVQTGGTVDGADVAIDRAYVQGVQVQGAGSTVTLSRLTVRGASARKAGGGGYAVSALSDGTLHLVSPDLSGADASGAYADLDGIITIDGGRIHDLRGLGRVTASGVGIGAARGGNVQAVGTEFDGNAVSGLAFGGGLIELSGVNIVDGTPPSYANVSGGLVAQPGGTVHGDGVAIANTVQFGVTAQGQGAVIELSASTVESVRPGPVTAYGALAIDGGSSAALTSRSKTSTASP
jgi:hypothetical protein